jgi:hypothetical protein
MEKREPREAEMKEMVRAAVQGMTWCPHPPLKKEPGSLQLEAHRLY